ncbi:H-type lectin domain-containing protein [Cognatiyoonia koreensis]|uniref:H-type lectin domain-containing protein n=1 Tax=Cognatiyoonia koreensis TaxID=364200 RepID=A0A1I0MW13_9RHOB|nr:H-type lectin domain-containing protein [Cognatiyoonia koreensis]SEV92967.1 H-type lectin domain-containing protein [Cognatiyoonia koreensis]
MRKIHGHLVGIDQGDVVLFSDFEHDGDMWTGEGPRKISVPVTFSESYDSPPSVTVSISMFDMSNEAFSRADVQAEKVTKSGFAITFRTWGDTKIARVRVAWQSIGALSSEDAWDI